MCERVFSVGFGPGLDSMSPARSRRSASHDMYYTRYVLHKICITQDMYYTRSCIERKS